MKIAAATNGVIFASAFLHRRVSDKINRVAKSSLFRLFLETRDVAEGFFEGMQG